MRRSRVYAGVAGAVVLCAAAAAGASQLSASTPHEGASLAFAPPPDSAIPKDQFGDEVRMGERIFREPGVYAPAFVGNKLQCSNCHLSAGRLAGAAPMWAAYPMFPAYRSKNGHVNSFEERLQGCFLFSMNGKAPSLGDPVLVALETYSFFLAKGAPIGTSLPGRGFPELPKPSLAADYTRGADVYSQRCAACHGPQGAGLSAGGKVVFPALWGAASYNWGAGMGSIKNAAAFIRANMPLGLGGSLSVQQAWDVADYMDSQVRPQDPRFLGSVVATRAAFHKTEFSMYGMNVGGRTLGDPASTPPFATVAAPARTPRPTAKAPEGETP